MDNAKNGWKYFITHHGLYISRYPVCNQSADINTPIDEFGLRDEKGEIYDRSIQILDNMVELAVPPAPCEMIVC